MNLVLPISKLFHKLQIAITHKIVFYYIYSNIQKYNNDKMYFHPQLLITKWCYNNLQPEFPIATPSLSFHCNPLYICNINRTYYHYCTYVHACCNAVRMHKDERGQLELVTSFKKLNGGVAKEAIRIVWLQWPRLEVYIWGLVRGGATKERLTHIKRRL